jgi:hypothetical protein
MTNLEPSPQPCDLFVKNSQESKSGISKFKGLFLEEDVFMSLKSLTSQLPPQ